jgi:hypothetical protein
MFGSKKKHILAEGAQALAVVTKVDYAKVAGMTIAQNYNYKLDLTLMVRPDQGAPFEAHTSDYFSQFAQPSIGAQFWVRYDPDDQSRVEIDQARIAADNAQVQTQVAAAAASAVPADLAAGGILGRGAIVDVQKTPVDQLVDCAVTVGVRLVDGTEPYRASCHIPLTPDQAEMIVPGGTYVTVRADPRDHSRIAISLTEETPVVTTDDPRVIEPPARALRDGLPCRIKVLLHARTWLQSPGGDEFYAIKLQVESDGSTFQANLPVPADALAMLENGASLPAKRLASEPDVIAIDWAAALAGAPA